MRIDPPRNTIEAVICAHAASHPDVAAILAPRREPLSYSALAVFIGVIRTRLNDWGIGRAPPGRLCSDESFLIAPVS